MVKNAGSVSSSGEVFGLDQNTLKVYGDDTYGLSIITGETEKEIKDQLLQRFIPYKYKSSLNSISPSFPLIGISSLNSIALEKTTPLLNTWTWNGAFPWVYNHETASWFYYHFAGNTCNAYDARNGNWFTFNGTSNSWVKSN